MYMTNPELFVPDNYLELCQGLQEVIASVPPDEQDIAGAKVREMQKLGRFQKFSYHS